MKRAALILAVTAMLPLTSCVTLDDLRTAALSRPLSFTITIHY